VSNNLKILDRTVSRALLGQGAHVEATDIVAGVDWKLSGTRPNGAPHSLFQLLNHIIYWQDWAVKWLDGNKPSIPAHASGSWPGKPGPASRKEWERAVRRFLKGLEELQHRCREADLFARPGKKSRLEMLHTIASHNSYHVGQIVLLRQMLGAWPPPSGGLTW